MKTPRFEIGTKFIKKQNIKNKRIETVTDIYKTYNSQGELIEIQYLVENEMMGQKVKGLVCETTIILGQLISTPCRA